MKSKRSNYKRVMMVGADPSAKGGVASVIRGYFDSGLIDSLGIRYYATYREGTKAEKILFYINSFIKIFFDMPKHCIVHLHTSSWWSFRRIFPVIVLARIFLKKIAVHLHSGNFDVYYKSANVAEKLIIRFAFFISDRALVLSKEKAKKISVFCNPEKIRIIPNAVLINRQDKIILKKKTSPPYTLTFFGKLCKQKGVYDLLEAIKLLDLERTQIKVILCGNGEIDIVKKRVADLGLEETVIVSGWISGEERKKTIDLAYLNIMPSYYEGLPMSILEAMAASTPVISTSVGGIPEAVENGTEGLLVKPGDISALANSINMLLSDAETWEKMSRAGRKKIEAMFSLKHNLSQLEKLYAEMDSLE